MYIWKLDYEKLFQNLQEKIINGEFDSYLLYEVEDLSFQKYA